MSTTGLPTVYADNLGPACAFGSRAVLPDNLTARRVILWNDCADYLECVGWMRGESRREYLRAAAIDYCAAAEWTADNPMGLLTPAGRHVVDAVESYMRRHVAAYISVLRRQIRESR